MIKNIEVFSVLNLIGEKTIEVKLSTENGVYSASVPSGTSKGKYEVVSLPIEKILKILPKLKKKLISLPENSKKIDSLLRKIDGTNNFSKIGGNLALAISIAVTRAETNNELWKSNQYEEKLFPLPVVNIIGGGLHGGGSDWQEFLVIPKNAKTFPEAVEHIFDFWHHVESELKKKKILVGKNIEKACMSKLNDIKTLDFLSKISEDFEFKLGVDFAASSLFDGKKYNYKKMRKTLSIDKQLNFIENIAKAYNLYYLEDAFDEEDFNSFSILTSKFRKKLIVGDDLYTTNSIRLDNGIKKKATNGIIIKPNQIGTLSLTENTVKLAKKNKISIIPSHRSKETEDTWLSDLAIKYQAPLIKIGMNDISKYNRLIELWNKIPKARLSKPF